ncbi:hypothetical protein D3C79_1098290 [compost metagenome]
MRYPGCQPVDAEESQQVRGQQGVYQAARTNEALAHGMGIELDEAGKCRERCNDASNPQDVQQ